MTISELRHTIGLSQRQFAERFGIPVGTLRNWEQRIATPPEYVFQMIYTSIRRDKMINLETIKFVKMLDELAELAENGIEPFENATHDSFRSKIYYDPCEINGEDGFPIVLDACIDDHIHHDIVSYYGGRSREYAIRVRSDVEGSLYIQVTLLMSEEIIIIENGEWYFA